MFNFAADPQFTSSRLIYLREIPDNCKVYTGLMGWLENPILGPMRVCLRHAKAETKFCGR